MTGACILLLCLGGNVYADFFAQGNAAYASGAMGEAIAAYEELVASGVQNPEVFYNLGSACYHLGDTGRAILNFERAIGLDRNLEAAHRALAVAAAGPEGQRARPAGFALDGREPTLIRGVPRNIAGGMALAFWWLAWGILAAGWRARRGRWKKVAAAIAGALLIATLALVYPTPAPRAAVILAADAPARYGPHTQDGVRMALAPGDRVLVDRVEAGWARVEVADGRRGWVEQHGLAYLGPPFVVSEVERESTDP